MLTLTYLAHMAAITLKNESLTILHTNLDEHTAKIFWIGRSVALALAIMTYILSHWIFGFKYFIVSLLLKN